MSEASEIKVGSKAILKVGRNAVTVEIISVEDGVCLVKNTATGKEFKVAGARLTVPKDTASPALETGKPEKKMSLMDAAVAALKEAGKPMNTREMVKAAIEKGYWVPTDCKTPEQTLYGSIFREMKVKEQPRIVKSNVKGKFRIA